MHYCSECPFNNDQKTLGLTPDASLKKALLHMNQRVGGSGGAICINAHGRYGLAFTTERMAWAIRSKDVSECGINPDERISFK